MMQGHQKHLVLFVSFQDEIVDLRQICLSVAALSGLFSFKSVLHTAFTVSPAGLSIYIYIYIFIKMKNTISVNVFMCCIISSQSSFWFFFFFVFFSCLTERAEAVWVQSSCPTWWGRCWVFLNATLLSFTLRRPIKAGSLKVSVSSTDQDPLFLTVQVMHQTPLGFWSI